MKTIYRNAPTTITGIVIDSVDNDYQLQAGETFSEPNPDLNIPYKINADGSYSGGTPEETAAALAGYRLNDPQITPTIEQQQLAELIKSNAQQTTLNAQLIKQVAALQTHTTQEAK